MYWFNFSFGHWRREKIKRTNNIAICGLVTMTFQLKTLLNQRPRQGCIFCKEASGICKTKGKMWGKSLKTVKTNKKYTQKSGWPILFFFITLCSGRHLDNLLSRRKNIQQCQRPGFICYPDHGNSTTAIFRTSYLLHRRSHTTAKVFS